MRFPGIIPAITTPFGPTGAIDTGALERNLAALLDAGVHGLVATGTMGEAGSLTRDERAAVVASVVDAAAGRAPVVAGVSAGTPGDAAAFARDAAAAGATALMLLPPLGYRGDAREVIAHYAAVAAATDLPLMAYNNPEASGTDMPASLVARLAAEVDAVVAVKECSGAAARMAGMRRRASRCSSAATTGRWRGCAPARPGGCRAWPAWRRTRASSCSRPAATATCRAPARSTRACSRWPGST